MFCSSVSIKSRYRTQLSKPLQAITSDRKILGFDPLGPQKVNYLDVFAASTCSSSVFELLLFQTKQASSLVFSAASRETPKPKGEPPRGSRSPPFPPLGPRCGEVVHRLGMLGGDRPKRSERTQGRRI